MQENVSIVITMIVFVILLVIFPLYNFYERQDDMSYNLALKETSTFADDVLNKGYITESMYAKLSNSLARTGNTYDIQMEAHKKILTKDPENPENTETFVEQPLNDYSKDINNVLSTGGTYKLNPGDEFYVKLKNKNTTNAGAIFSSFIGKSSKETIAVNYGGMIKYNKWKEEETNQIIGSVSLVFQLIGGTHTTNELGDPIFTTSDTNKIVFRATVDNVTNNSTEIKKILTENAKLNFTVYVYKYETNPVTKEDELKTTVIENNVLPEKVTLVAGTENQYDLTYTLAKSTYFSGDYEKYYSQDVYLKLSAGVFKGVSGTSNTEYISNKIVVLAPITTP